MDFDSFLSRADDLTLQTLVGSSAVRLLRLLDPSLATPSNLRNLLVQLRSREGLLLAKDSRASLIDLLRPEDLKILAAVLGQPTTGDCYQRLKEVSISSGSSRERALFDFFELTVPIREQHDQLPSIEVGQSSYPLFSHQRRAVSEIKQLLQEEPRRALLHMPTGSGKTRTAMNIIAEHLRNNEPTLVIWLAYSEELCEQAVGEFQKAWGYLGNREINVYRYWGSHTLDPEQSNDGFLVAGLSKLYSTLKKSLKFLGSLGSHCSLVVMDEAHQAVAQTYKLTLDVLVVPFPQTSLLGLTATPGRTWSDITADEELANFFARRKVTLDIPGYSNPVDYLVAEGYLARATYTSLLYESGLSMTPADLKYVEEVLELPPTILNQLAEDEQRNLSIINKVETLAKHHIRILVFAITVQHSRLLASVLQARGLNAFSISGETPAAERNRLIRSYKDSTPESKILCNYGVLTTGFDAPLTSAAIIARPTKSLVLYSQMVGRAIRGIRAGGNKTAEIVTVVDTDLPGFGAVAEAFTNWEDVWRN